jgi:hypothetical protein
MFLGLLVRLSFGVSNFSLVEERWGCLKKETEKVETKREKKEKPKFSYSATGFDLFFPNFSLAVNIFSVANSLEAMYIMTTVNAAT